MWRTQYDETLLFVRRMTFGINARTGMQTLERLSQLCTRSRAEPRGDIIAALHHVRDNEVAGCMERADPAAYRRLRSKLKGKEQSRSVIEFVRQGFPADILPVATKCDPDLAAELESEARRLWWKKVFAGS